MRLWLVNDDEDQWTNTNGIYPTDGISGHFSPVKEARIPVASWFLYVGMRLSLTQKRNETDPAFAEERLALKSQ